MGRGTIAVALAKTMSSDSLYVLHDLRGRRRGNRGISKYERKEIENHISSYPSMDPHYVRKSSRRKYLDSTLSIAKMHAQFLELNKHNKLSNTKLSTYRYIFNTEFNFSFFRPKKDQCLQCSKFKDLLCPTELERKMYDQHLESKNQAQEDKAKDKQKASIDPDYYSFTFDLQSVLYTPCSSVSSLYYTRKLSVYNLTVYDQVSKDGSCYMWDQCNGQRGSCEIGTCLVKHIQSLPRTCLQASFYSDSCGGQNRNKFIVGALRYALLSSHVEAISIKFLVLGHTEMECDSMHSAIENSKKYGQKINIPNDWYNIIKSARKSQPYLIYPLEFSDFLNFKPSCNVLNF